MFPSQSPRAHTAQRSTPVLGEHPRRPTLLNPVTSQSGSRRRTLSWTSHSAETGPGYQRFIMLLVDHRGQRVYVIMTMSLETEATMPKLTLKYPISMFIRQRLLLVQAQPEETITVQLQQQQQRLRRHPVPQDLHRHRLFPLRGCSA